MSHMIAAGMVRSVTGVRRNRKISILLTMFLHVLVAIVPFLSTDICFPPLIVPFGVDVPYKFPGGYCPEVEAPIKEL